MHCVGIGKAATNGAPNSENSGNFLAMKMKSDHHPTLTTTPICDLALSDGGSLDTLRAVLQPLQQNGAKSVGYRLDTGTQQVDRVFTACLVFSFPYKVLTKTDDLAEDPLSSKTEVAEPSRFGDSPVE